jgi:hypothetical protein
MIDMPNPETIAEKIGILVTDWPFNCYFIACRVVDAGLTPGGVPVYGHYLGPIADGSLWADRRGRPFIRHGWVVMPDGSIVDPTRWCFDNKGPYIYTASKESAAEEYDEGGNALLTAMMKHHPRPEWNPEDPKPFVIFFDTATDFVRSLLQCPKSQPDNKYNVGQLFWLANLPYNVIGDHLLEICDALKPAKLIALIPIDNRTRAEREYGGPHGPTP